MSGIPIARVNLSLPCKVPVVPGTDDETAPIEERTELCATDAWWFIGAAPICDRHLRRLLVVLGDDYDDICREVGATASEKELLPWNESYRYSQESARL